MNVASQKISVVAVIGAGTMGPKIAYRCAVSGLQARLTDKFPQALANGKERIEGWIDKKLGPDEAARVRSRLTTTESLAKCLEGADLVIETVPEDLELKRRVLAEIDRLAPQAAFIATNSSSLPCSRMADATGRPEKVFNINFSQPEEESDLLVEVMRGQATAPETIVVAEGFVRSLKMVPIITYKEIMGFSFNRLWRAIKREVLHLVDGGHSDHQDLDRAWIMEFGTSFGPFGLMDIIGLDVVRDIENQYYLDSGEERDKPPKLLDEMIAQGRLGVKTGVGFYNYPNPAYHDPAWLKKQRPYAEDISSSLSA